MQLQVRSIEHLLRCVIDFLLFHYNNHNFKNKIMKKIIILFCAIGYMPIYSQWYPIYSANEILNDVYCISENTVIAVGNAGTILKTTNGGVTWVQKTSGTTYDLKKVQFPSMTVGYAISKFTTDNVMLKTIDGGETWTTINFGVSSVIIDIASVDQNIIYVTYKDQNSNPIFKKSINGGVTFNVINSNIAVNNIQFINDQIGFSGIQNNPGSGGNLYKTIDGGITWYSMQGDVTAFHFINENIGFTYSIIGVSKTIDSGMTYSSLGTYNVGFNKFFATAENIVWGTPMDCPLNGSPCYSIRGEMLNNETFQTDTGLPFKSLHFANPTKGYAVIDSNIYKNNTGILLGTNEIGISQNPKIYPNPTKGILNLKFPENRGLKGFNYKITNLLGQIMEKKDISTSGKNELSINTAGFANGVYQITIETDKGNWNEKFVKE